MIEVHMLSDKKLFETYLKAVKQDLDDEFIALLEKEISLRGIDFEELPIPFNVKTG